MNGMPDRMETIVVYSDRKTALIQMIKHQASVAASGYDWGSKLTTAIGGGLFVGGIANSNPGTKVIMVAGAPTFIMLGANSAMVAATLAQIAADPPRPAYKADPCRETILVDMPSVPKEFAEAGKLMHLLGRLALELRAFLDAVELFQGAEAAKDTEWMNRHYDNARLAYKGLYDASLDSAKAYESALSELDGILKPAGTSVDKIMADAVGAKAGDYKDAARMLRNINAGQKDMMAGVVDDFLGRKISAVSKKDTKGFLDGLTSFANQLAVPS